MKSKTSKFLSLLLAGSMVFSLVACGDEEKKENTDSSVVESSTTEESKETTAEPTNVSTGSDTPLVVGYSPFSQKFSPFTADTGYDQDAASMTQVSLMTTDRTGGIIYNAIEGETVSYNGTDYTYTGIADLSVDFDEATNLTTYTAKLKEGIKFSDGVEMTADDIIFTYYVYCDPAYMGSTSLNSFAIVGLKDYMTQTTSELYAKYAVVVDAMYNAGKDYKVSDKDDFTQEQFDAFWADIDAGAATFAQGIVDYVAANYCTADYVEQSAIGFSVDEINAEAGLQVAYGMIMWGYGAAEEGVLTTKSGATFDLANGTYPTAEDYALELYLEYEKDYEAAFASEATGSESGSFVEAVKNSYITALAADEPELEGGIPNIAGITKLDDYTVQVVVEGYEASAVYSILGIQVTPMHYYGDEALYDYDNNMFGHPYGDLSLIDAKEATPMGAGPYKFIEYSNKTIYYEANENYYKGCPAIKNVQFKEVVSAEVAAGVQTGTIDCGEMTGSVTRFQEVQSYNSNGEITGDVISTSKVDNLGYGYIGMNADTVLVGDDPSSEESKNLRKAIATILSVCRDTAIDSYYGEAASVINYPISNTSWAAPQATDEGYKLAYSVDVDGKDIYSSDMSAEDKYAAAVEAAKNYFVAAGYTLDSASGKLTAAPNGAKLSYTVMIPADGSGDHPSFAILTDAQALLAEIGFELVIDDLSDSSKLWTSLDAGSQELWCAAWGATIDPDMYQVYHSNNIVGKGGTDSNHYHIADASLDSDIMNARTSDDQSFRKAIYKGCLETIMDWAVEIPIYQRQNCIVFSTERINMDTMTPDITTFYGWMQEIENIQMK